MSLLWLRLAVILYGIAALAVLPAALYDRPRWTRIAIPAALAGAFFHFVSLAETLSAAHRALPVDTHETLSLLGLLLSASFLILAAKYRTVSFGIFLLPIAALLAIVPAFRPGHETIAYPLIHTGWLLLHIALLLAAYAALFLSLIASLLYLIQERRLKLKRPQPTRSWLPPLETLDQIALNALRFGLPCMTAGLLIGSVLALQTIGPTFFADPKVLLSIAMWVAYVLMIFIRRHSGLRGRRAVYLSSFVFLVVLAVWAANSLSTVHSFKAPRTLSELRPNSKLLILGVNHTTAPIEVRERLAIPIARLADATRTLAHQPGVREALILSTCNRVELLTVQDTADADSPGPIVPGTAMLQFLDNYLNVRVDDIQPHVYEFREREAIRHLFRVASSLDSMVVGEAQILGQVKQSWTVAREVGAIGSTDALKSTLDPLLQRAFSVAKRVRTETQIGSSTVSIASVAAELARKIFGSLSGKTVLLVGAGKMSDLTARHLIQQGATTLLVSNRTEARAEKIADSLRTPEITTGVIPFDLLHEQSHRADIIITSTGAGQIFQSTHARALLQRRKNRPVFFIDIAVPRDVAPDVNNVEGCFVYDIDDLQQVAVQNRAVRSREAEAAESIVTKEVARYTDRLSQAPATEAIKQLLLEAETTRLAELARLTANQTLTPDQYAAIDRLTKSLTAKLLHPQIAALREVGKDAEEDA